MTCKICTKALPGNIIKTDAYGKCINCGDIVSEHNFKTYSSKDIWDNYYHKICVAVASKSPCLSRKIGSILVRDKSILSTGYNGPPRNIPHCGHRRIMTDSLLHDELTNYNTIPSELVNTCPRKLMGFVSGSGLEWCNAQHSETNCLSNAARLGVSVVGATLYMNFAVPCKDCFGALINAGIIEIVVKSDKIYDKHASFICDNSEIIVREFNLKGDNK